MTTKDTPTPTAQGAAMTEERLAYLCERAQARYGEITLVLPGEGKLTLGDLFSGFTRLRSQVREAERVRAEALETAARLCDEEGDARLKNAEAAKGGDWTWGNPLNSYMVQNHKGVTARALAKAIRALTPQPAPTGSETT